jgi:transcriptional regulator with XRE-family HTH domain
MNFASFMLGMRPRAGLSMAEAGRRGGVSHAAISTWELGHREPTVSNAAAVADVYGASLGFFIDGKFYPLEVER